MTKKLKIIPNWRNLTKSGHTGVILKPCSDVSRKHSRPRFNTRVKFGQLENPLSHCVLRWSEQAFLAQVIDEGLLLPLYHCFGSAIASPETGNRDVKNRIKTGLVICCVVYTIFEGSISAATPGNDYSLHINLSRVHTGPFETVSRCVSGMHKIFSR